MYIFSFSSSRVHGARPLHTSTFKEIKAGWALENRGRAALRTFIGDIFLCTKTLRADTQEFNAVEEECKTELTKSESTVEQTEYSNGSHES